MPKRSLKRIITKIKIMLIQIEVASMMNRSNQEEEVMEVEASKINDSKSSIINDTEISVDYS